MLTGDIHLSPMSYAKLMAKSTVFFSCKNRPEQKKFEKFLRADFSLTTLVLFIIISSLSAIFNKGITYRNYPTNLALISAVCSAVFEVVLGWSFLVIFNKFRQSLTNPDKWENILSVVENVYILGYNLSLIMSAFVFVANGYCPSHDVYAKNIGCNSSSINQFQEGTMALLLMVPIMLSTVVKSAKSETIFFIWFQNFGILLYFFTAYNFRLSVGSLVLFSFITFLCLYEFQRQKITMYFVAQELGDTKTENERLAAENRASELKHLIGNVAHDLKTPLSSLNMGIDLINGVLEELAALTANDIPNMLKECVFQHIAAVEENLLNMKNVNSFMLMNINRCMDYTKASNGLKLVPKNETAPLLETIALPLHVMNAMHDGKTHIELRPIPQTIASHIITDKQWLQENILCLLSNAVKYSNRGVATITISLVEREQRRVTMITPATTAEGTPSRVLSQKPSPPNSSKKFQLWRNITYLPAPKYDKTTVDGKDSGIEIFRTASTETRDISTSINPNMSTSISHRQSSGSRRIVPIVVAPASPSRSGKTFVPMLRFEVEDTGIGLSEEVMETLFSPFKQAQRLAGGTGLGLFSLSRRIDSMYGNYGVQKRHDGAQGSVFWFEIPYKPDSEYANNLSHMTPHMSFNTVNLTTAQRKPSFQTIHVATSRNGNNSTSCNENKDNDYASVSFKEEHVLSMKENERLANERITTHSPLFFGVGPSASSKSNANANRISLNILLADDTLSIQKMTKMLLKKQGHSVTVAENGAEALEIIVARYSEPDLCRSPFDVVLMDFQMPIMDGLEATRRIRAFEEKLKKEQQKRDLSMSMSDFDNSACALSYHQRIIGLSANSDEETVQLALDAGLDDFMEKPFKAAIFDDIYNRMTLYRRDCTAFS